MKIQHFFDKETNTLTYVVSDDKGNALVIDPVLDFDPAGGVVTSTSFEIVKKYIEENKYQLLYILETHVHADHLSSSQLFKSHFKDAKIGVSERIVDVQKTFSEILDRHDFKADGGDFDLLFNEDSIINVGNLSIKIIPVPGHTPACVAFLIGDALFTGDSLFMPDYGTGRCDFPGGSAEKLFDSVMRLYSLPAETRVFVGHDYLPNDRELRFMTTIGESKTSNIHLKFNTSKDDFVKFRTSRDSTLKSPRLLYPSLAVNIAAGILPRPEVNGRSYIKIPLTLKER